MQMQKLKCAHKNVAAAQKKRKQNGQTFCKYYYNIFCHLFILFAGVCECVGVCGVCWVFYYFCWLHDNKFAFKSPSPSPLPSLLSSRRLARSVFAFFSPAWHFFQGCCSACGPLFGRPCRLCVCVCVDIHTTLLTTKCHMILF